MSEHTDAIAVAAGKAASVGGGVSAVIFGWNAADLAALAGVIVAILGILVQVYFGRRKDRRDAEYQAARDRREQEYHAARLMWREDNGED